MKKLILALTVCALVMLPMVAMADYVYVGAGDFTGTRVGDNVAQVTATEAWADANNFQLGWEVTQVGSLFTYKYTIYAAGRGGDLSHIIFQLSPEGFNFEGTPGGNYSKYEGPRNWGPGTPGEEGNPGLAEVIYGVKFETTPTTSNTTEITFQSYNQPVWGDFYVKGGQTYAFNAGIATDPVAAGPFDGYIVVPNSLVVPIPGSLLLLGSGLLGLFGLRRKLS